MEILIVAFLLFLSFAIYLYFSIKTKDLSIQLLDKEEAKKVFENLINKSKDDLIDLRKEIQLRDTMLEQKKELEKTLMSKNRKLRDDLVELSSTLETKIKEAVDTARADSIKRQRSILKGQATEHLAPYINSNYNPKDYKFIGDPIDYIIYDGLSEIKSKEDQINKIVFMDIKTGKSQLNRAQRAIKKCIQEGSIEFEIYRPEKDIELDKESSDKD
jgi:predicted Holliday junction resolvase-like endonuclease